MLTSWLARWPTTLGWMLLAGKPGIVGQQVGSRNTPCLFLFSFFRLCYHEDDTTESTLKPGELK